MKTTLTVTAIFLFLLNSTAQTSTTGNVKAAADTQKAGVDVFIKIEDINGESPDTLRPKPGNIFSIGGGAVSARIINSNISQRFSIAPKTGFTVNAGYAFSMKKGRLQINAAYSEGGVYVASGDINGDGHNDKETMKLGFLSLPVQYLHFIGKKNIFYVGGGAYAAMLVPAIQKVKAYDEGIEKQEAGLIGSAGVIIAKKLMLQASYQYGLTDIDPSAANKAKNGMAFITLNYALFGKAKSKPVYGPVITIKPKG
jgi:Outer membrane protein beta-barrel domain